LAAAAFGGAASFIGTGFGFTPLLLGLALDVAADAFGSGLAASFALGAAAFAGVFTASGCGARTLAFAALGLRASERGECAFTSSTDDTCRNFAGDKSL
jgi:hypothetical protein